MARSRLTIMCIASVAVMFAAGCSGSGQVFDITAGNYRYSGGDFTGATLAYLNALEKEQTDPRARYDLGNVYIALGEPEFGERELLVAASSGDRESAFRSRFNLGLVYAEQGEYRTSIESFKHALRIDPGSVVAKRNLEIVIRKLENENERRASGQSGETRMTSQVKETLKNAQDKEVFVWKPGKSGSGSDSARDW